MKQWIIRSFFIGLLVLCVGGWVMTLNQSFHLTLSPLPAKPRPYPFTDTILPAVYAEQSFVLTAYRGSLTFRHHHTTVDASDGTPASPVTLTVSRQFPQWFADADFNELRLPSVNILGFRSFSGLVGGRGTSEGNYLWSYQTYLTTPFWFLTAVSAALLWFAWRKTRAKVKGRAFPVEVAAKEKQP